MLLFRQIFDFERTKVVELDQRYSTRYAPGPAFPLRSGLIQDGFEWPTRVLDLSSDGIGLLLTGENGIPNSEEPVVAMLSIGGHRLELASRLIRHQLRDDGIACGLSFGFRDFLLQKAYLQLLQPIAIGQSLAAVPAAEVVQNEPQFQKLMFRGKSDSALTVWLENQSASPLHSFEFQMHDYFCHAQVRTGVLEAYLRETTDSFQGKLTNPVFHTTGLLQEEIRQLFRWIVPNLSEAVPASVRASLAEFAARLK